MNAKPIIDQRTIETIIDVICDHFHVEQADLKAKLEADFIFVRKITVYILSKRYKLSGIHTARMLGYRQRASVTKINAEISHTIRHESLRDHRDRETTELVNTLCNKIEAKLHPQPLIISPKSAPPRQDPPAAHNPARSFNDLIGIAVRVCPPILRKAPPLANAGISPLEVSKRIAIYIAWKDRREKVALLSHEFGVEAEDVLSAIGFVEYFGSDGLSSEIHAMLAGVRSQVAAVS